MKSRAYFVPSKLTLDVLNLAVQDWLSFKEDQLETATHPDEIAELKSEVGALRQIKAVLWDPDLEDKVSPTVLLAESEMLLLAEILGPFIEGEEQVAEGLDDQLLRDAQDRIRTARVVRLDLLELSGRDLTSEAVSFVRWLLDPCSSPYERTAVLQTAAREFADLFNTLDPLP